MSDFRSSCVRLVSIHSELENKFQLHFERAFTRKFLINIQRIQAVVLIAQIQDAELDFTAAIQKAITRVDVFLNETVTGDSRTIA